MSFKERYSYKDKSFLLSSLSLISTVGIIFFLTKAWSVIPSNGFWEYIQFAVFSFVLILIPIVNLVIFPEEKSFYNILINGVLVLPTIWAIYSVYKSFNLPSNGFVEYLIFVCFFGLLFLASTAYFYFNFHKYSLSTSIINGVLGIVFLSFTLYSIGKAIESIPSIYFLGAAFLILLAIGGVSTLGTNEY
jgi:hypothetical protein